MSNDKAIIDRQAAQIAMLREALHVGRALTMGYINGALTEKIINAALNATAADVEAWQAAQAPASPDMVSVPRYPTPEMCIAGMNAMWDKGVDDVNVDDTAECYRAMIGAAK